MRHGHLWTRSAERWVPVYGARGVPWLGNFKYLVLLFTLRRRGKWFKKLGFESGRDQTD